MELNKFDLENIVKGACMLASGGGGTYTSGMSLVKHFKDTYYPDELVKVVSVKEAISEIGVKTPYAVMVAYMGAPEAIEDLQYPIAAVSAAKAIQEYVEKEKGGELKYLVPVEVGAFSSLVPCMVAKKLGLKVIDGDGAGRAVPELTMTTFSDTNISASPSILATNEGLTIKIDLGFQKINSQILEQFENQASLIETIARPVISDPSFNQLAGLSMWVMNMEQLDKAITIRGTLLAAKELGEMITEEKSLDEILDKINQISNEIDQTVGNKNVYKMYYGTIESADCNTNGGFDHGEINIRCLHKTIKLIFQNESLLLWDEELGQPQAMAPDSIAYYIEKEGETQFVYSNADLVINGELVVELKNARITVIGIKASDRLREINSNNQRIMKSFQDVNRQLGYYGSYLKLEDIWSKK